MTFGCTVCITRKKVSVMQPVINGNNYYSIRQKDRITKFLLRPTIKFDVFSRRTLMSTVTFSFFRSRFYLDY